MTTDVPNPRFQVKFVRDDFNGEQVEQWIDMGDREGRAHRIAKILRAAGMESDVYLVRPVVQPRIEEELPAVEVKFAENGDVVGILAGAMTEETSS